MSAYQRHPGRAQEWDMEEGMYVQAGMMCEVPVECLHDPKIANSIKKQRQIQGERAEIKVGE